MSRFSNRSASSSAEILVGAGDADVAQLHEDTAECTGASTLTGPTIGTLAQSPLGAMSEEAVPTSAPLRKQGRCVHNASLKLSPEAQIQDHQMWVAYSIGRFIGHCVMRQSPP